jgi:hypothetical protein
VVQLHRDEPLLQASGLALHVIGNGAPTFIAGFRETTGFTGAIYTDPSLAVFRAAELRSGLRTILSLGAIARTFGSLRRGFRQGRTQGSALQQGGVLVIAPDGGVRWQHVSSGPGDNATAVEIVAAVA